MYIHHTKNTGVVFLDEYGRTPLVVSDEIFTQIQELVARGRACRTCGDCYTQENPRVSQNMCKTCYLRAYPGYAYQGRLHPTTLSYEPHLYLDTSTGKIYTSNNVDDDEPDENEELTLAHYGYALPKVYGEDSCEVYTNTYLYGTLGDAVLLVRLQERRGYGDREWLFLCDRRGNREVLTRRGKQYQTAKKAYQGHISKYERHESDILELVAKLANGA